MPAELTEGSTYLIRATTINMSTKAGVPVAATLTVNIAAVVNSQGIMEDSEVYGFAADETHTFEFSMAVPMGTGGKAGAVVAEVLDPNGNKLADGSLDIVIAAPAPPEFVYVSEIRHYYYDFDSDYFTVDVQNIGGAGVCTLEFWVKWDARTDWRKEWRLAATVSHTLQPGEIRTFGDGHEFRCRVSNRYVWHWYVKFIGEPGIISLDGDTYR